MKKAIVIGLAVVLPATAVLIFMAETLSRRLTAEDQILKSTFAKTRDSVMALRREVDSLRQQLPGLGEYMSSIQLHVSKLWFAGRSLNWPLADYELGELGEAVEGAETLHARRNDVDITGVLQSLHQTQFELLRTTILKKEKSQFLDAYQQTLATCNGCHRSAGYGYIHVVTPAAPPVTNQRWEPEGR